MADKFVAVRSDHSEYETLTLIPRCIVEPQEQDTRIPHSVTRGAQSRYERTSEVLVTNEIHAATG